MRSAAEPGEHAISIVDAGDAATGKEPIAKVADGSLDLALVLRHADRTQLGLYAHRCAKREQGRVKPDGGADALDDDDLGIVEQPLAWKRRRMPRRRARASGTANGR